MFQPKKFSLMNYNLNTSKGGGGNSKINQPKIETKEKETK